MSIKTLISEKPLTLLFNIYLNHKMCGIAGIVAKNNQKPYKNMIWSMSRSMKHRGPDGEGFIFINNSNVEVAYTEDTPKCNIQSASFKFNPTKSIDECHPHPIVSLAHRRLSIIDLSESGHQPMCDIDANIWITFNGEIYNYIEIRNELKQKGHVFVTQTDTEVVINAYKEWGNNCVNYFNGMFAFAIYDISKNILFCARDRAGVKPFYYSNSQDEFAFASEHKAFIKSGLIPFSINEQEQFDFIIHGNLETREQSLFNGIYELKPAHYLIYNVTSHQFTTQPYFNFDVKETNHLSEKEIIQTIEEKLVKSIELRLRSDVEVGSCLSGGLDSSIIACVSKKLQPQKRMNLFSVIFPSESFNESNYAQLVAHHVNGYWHSITPIAHDFFNDIEQVNYFQDLPIWSTSTYSQHKVMQLASNHQIKVVLDGQGADELFAGYAHHFIALNKEQFSLKQLNEAKQSIPNIYSLFTKQLIKDALKLDYDYSAYLNKEKTSLYKSTHQSIASNLNQQLLADYQGKLKSFLKCEDRCSMAFGIESRVPFSDDVELFNFIFSIKGKLKIQQGISKYLLREATKNVLPQQIYNRKDKIGFDTPIKSWLLPNKHHVLETIAQNDYVNMSNIKHNFEKLLINKPNFILRLYSLTVWQKIFN